MIEQDTLSFDAIQTRDFEAICEAERGWDQRYDLVRPGGFEGKITLCQIGERQLSEVYWGNRVRYQGGTPPGNVALGLPIIQSAAGKWLGIDANRDDVIIQRSGREADFVGPAKWRTLVFSTPERRFLDIFSAISGQPDMNPEFLQGVVSLFPEHASRLRLKAGAFFAAAVEATKATGRRLDSSYSLTQMLDAFEYDFVWAISQVSSSHFSPPAFSPPEQIVRRAEEYSRSVIHRSVSILELCRVCEVGERTLHAAFNQALETSPSSWLRTLRLNRAYKALRGSEPQRGFIKAVALEHGFGHFGRFSEQYGLLFGETPSATLARV